MDRLITVVGGSGFIGRYVVQELCKAGERVRVVTRDTQKALFLKPLGAVGQVQLFGGDIMAPKTIAAACDGAEGVINLVGILGESAHATFDEAHVEGAETVALAAARGGAGALVHVSALGADPKSPSAYGRSKGEGEAAVRDAFAAATIVRPSVVFGPEDNFINRFAGLANLLPVVPVVAPRTRFQPVYALDVARGIVAALEAAHAGKTFELGGPKVYTMRELIEWIMAQTYAQKSLVEVPDSAAGMLASLFGWLPGAPLTRDQWLMLKSDNVGSGALPGLEAFGIRPTPLEAVAPAYLVRYRKHGRFNRGEQDNKAY